MKEKLPTLEYSTVSSTLSDTNTHSYPATIKSRNYNEFQTNDLLFRNASAKWWKQVRLLYNYLHASRGKAAMQEKQPSRLRDSTLRVTYCLCVFATLRRVFDIASAQHVSAATCKYAIRFHHTWPSVTDCLTTGDQDVINRNSISPRPALHGFPLIFPSPSATLLHVPHWHIDVTLTKREGSNLSEVIKFCNYGPISALNASRPVWPHYDL